MSYAESALELKKIKDPHYNCCQAVLVPVAREVGLSDEMARGLGSNFGLGMRRKSACGAVVGGLLALGLLGKGDTATTAAFHQAFSDRCGALDCGDLLEIQTKNPGAPKHSCNYCIQVAAELVEELGGAT